MNNIRKDYIKRILKIELNDAYLSINIARNRTFHLARIALRGIPVNILNSFFNLKTKNMYVMNSYLKEKGSIRRLLS